MSIYNLVVYLGLSVNQFLSLFQSSQIGHHEQADPGLHVSKLPQTVLHVTQFGFHYRDNVTRNRAKSYGKKWPGNCNRIPPTRSRSVLQSVAVDEFAVRFFVAPDFNRQSPEKICRLGSGGFEKRSQDSISPSWRGNRRWSISSKGKI